MPKEKESYRDNLERIDTAFPGKELLKKADVARFCGIDYHTAGKKFDFTDNYISKAKLARQLS